MANKKEETKTVGKEDLQKVAQATNNALDKVDGDIAKAKKSQAEFKAEVDQSLGEVKEEISEIKEGISGLAEMMKGFTGKFSNELQSDNHMPKDCDVVDDGESGFIITSAEQAATPGFDQKVKALAFAQERVTVIVHETSEEDADEVVMTSVNGKTELYRRGTEKVVARCHVEVLARAKKTTYGNEKYRKQNGDESIRHPARHGLRYGFSVVEDKNPVGREWLKIILAQR